MTPYLAAALVALGALGTSLAPGECYEKPKRSLAIIQQQLEQSLRLQEVAVQHMQAETVKEALRSTWDGYVLLRSAHQSVETNLIHQKMKDPVQQTIEKRLAEARRHLIRAMQIMRSPASPFPEGLPWHLNAAKYVRDSIQQVRTALALGFV